MMFFTYSMPLLGSENKDISITMEIIRNWK